MERKENKSNSICQRAKFCLQVTGPELKIYGGQEWSDIVLEPHPVGPQGPKGEGHFLALQVFHWMALLIGLSVPQKPCRQWLLGQLLASAVFYELFINFYCGELATCSPFLQCQQLNFAIPICIFPVVLRHFPLRVILLCEGNLCCCECKPRTWPPSKADLGKKPVKMRDIFHTGTLKILLLPLLAPRGCPMYCSVHPKLLHLFLLPILTSGCVHTWLQVPSWVARAVCP